LNQGFLLTRARTGRQRAGRAFAAGLLAPAAGVETLLDRDPGLAEAEDYHRLADHYLVSATVIDHQVDNQLLSHTGA
jgi:hypothetical protein